jgi:hydantoinase/carbamoylase family amidase
MSKYHNLTINPNRLIEAIHSTAEWGAKGVWGPKPTDTGVCRLALSDFDKQVRDWFIGELQQLKCEIKVDQMGNIFGIYPGKNSGLPTGIGSHLDTQPNGGRYDGIYGVLSGLEVLKTFHDNNYVPNYPVAVVNWTNEEGARFPQSIISSSVWAGLVPLQHGHKLKSLDDTPVTLGDELVRIGYNGTTPASYKENPLAAHFEIHIEQGPILQNEHKEIGVVTGVQAYEWNRVTIKGQSAHAGTTPMNARCDALQISSMCILKGIEIAKLHGGCSTVGTLSLEPSSVNVIPNLVCFTYDVRHPDSQVVRAIVEESKHEFEKIASKGNGSPGAKLLVVEWELIQTSPTITFNETCVTTVKQAALDLFPGKVREIVSGAGHDSVSTSCVCPTSMIFIPSKDGLSHTPEEYSTPDQISNGFRVLLKTIMAYDEKRTKDKI